MKALTHEELNAAPGVIQFIYCASIYKQPVGLKHYEEVIEKYPQYFPEEIEHRRKWALIPQEVHTTFNKELETARLKIYELAPKSKGIMHWSQNFKDYVAYEEEMKPLHELYKKTEEVLRAKHYHKYLK